jgi:hypothetical protein
MINESNKSTDVSQCMSRDQILTDVPSLKRELEQLNQIAFIELRMCKQNESDEFKTDRIWVRQSWNADGA